MEKRKIIYSYTEWENDNEYVLYDSDDKEVDRIYAVELVRNFMQDNVGFEYIQE